MQPSSSAARSIGSVARARSQIAAVAAAPPAAPHVCNNAQGGTRCDICFGPVPTPPPRNRLLEASSELRKKYPITTGVLDYFPDAIAAVAEVSFEGNQQHNPGEPLHWARGKSMDHADCMARHLVERGGFDKKIRHSAALAWRALANLQEELEAEMGLAPPRGAG